MARARQVRLYRELENGWIVRKGLQAGDRIVVEGVIRVRPGNVVKPVPVAAPAAPAPTAGTAQPAGNKP